jgi:hypothetical protein
MSTKSSIKRYGKSSSSLLNQKTSFFEDNDQHLEIQNRIAAVYTAQPERTECKNCATVFNKNADFVKDGIGYIICDTCSHLSGIYEDTVEFCESLYTKESGKNYAINYNSKTVSDYNYKTGSIYLPKAEFLYSTLLSKGVDPDGLNYMDFGAGSGYFTAALRKLGLTNVKGTEVSKTQVELGNAMMGEEVLNIHNMDDTNETLSNISAEVVSMIGVLEHLQNPREALAMLRDNSNVKYLYISVPTFSLSVFLEILSTDIFHRQLSCGHTHLYTDESLNYMAKEFGFDIVGEWWFGTDMVDLFRHTRVTLEKIKASKKMIDAWSSDFVPLIDAMQLEMDKRKYSSEVHILLEKK